MDKEPQIETITFSEFLYKLSILKFLDILGLLFLSFLFYYFISILFTNVLYYYTFYLVFFSLLVILIIWHSEDTKVFFIISAIHYFIILAVSYFYL